MDTVDRIKELCKERQMNQQALAIAVGIKEDTVSNWFRRKSASFSKYLLQIAEALDTTTEYLLTGNGPKHRDHAYLFMDASGSMAGGKGGQIFGALETLDLGSGEAAAQLDKKEPAPINGDGLSPAKRQLLEAVDDLTDEQCEKLLGIVLEAKRLL